MIRIVLPWPCRHLHPNSRVHWSVRARAAKAARRDAYMIACGMGARVLGWDGLAATVTFCPPSRRRMDLDGCLSANKAHLDGIADATGVDDSRWSLALRWGEVVRGGQVVVEIERAAGVGVAAPAAEVDEAREISR